MKKSILFQFVLLFALCLTPFVLNAATKNKIPVVVLSTNADSIHRTLTFTYGVPDENLSQGQDGTYALNIGSNLPKWVGTRDKGDYKITKVVFEESFSEARPTTTDGWFYFLPNLDTIVGIEYLNTSKVTDMSNMFYGCWSLTSIDVSNFDTKNVTDMSGMFEKCRSLTSLNVSNFDTKNVADMSRMFDNCFCLTSLDVSNFDTRDVTDMSFMFENCSKLISLDVSNFDTKNVTDMSGMFDNCRNLTSLDISNFDTKNVTDMSSMFGGCSSLTNIDVSNFDTKKVIDMSEIFYWCYSLTILDVSNFDTKNVNNMRGMFGGCSGLTNLNLSDFDTKNVTNMGSMFEDCSRLTSLDVGHFDTKNVTSMYRMFSECSSLTSLDVSKINTENVNSLYKMFYDCRSLAFLDVSNFDTKNVTDMMYMFSGCSSLTCLDVSNFDTKYVTRMDGMFERCSSLISLDVSNFDTKNVTIMSGMFEGCSSLACFDISNFDTKKVTWMSQMFAGCSSLKILNIGNNSFRDRDNTEDAFSSVGETNNPCNLIIGRGFSNFVLGTKTDDYYKWLNGYFAEPIIGETVMTNSAGYAAYTPKSDIDFTLSENVRAYKARYDSNSKNIVLTEVTATPAGTPLIINGPVGMDILVSSESTPDAVTGNDLQTSSEDITADGSQWIFVTQESGSQAKAKKLYESTAQNVGFKKVAEGTTIKAGKVYLVIDPSSVSDDFISIDNIATGIKSVRPSATSGTAQMYNLSGQRVGKDYKVLVIKDGRKIIKK